MSQSHHHLTIDISQFQARLSELGLGDLELLAPVGVVDGSHLDWGIVVGPDEIALMERMQGVLFPGHPFELQDALAAARSGDDPVVIEQKWRNRELDAQGLWCHLRYGGDVLVTLCSSGSRSGSRLKGWVLAVFSVRARQHR